jgi:hypothetical protein
MRINLPKRLTPAAALASVIVFPVSLATAAPAYADQYGKIYSLASSPGNCLQADVDAVGPFQFGDDTSGCVNADYQQWSYLTSNQLIESGAWVDLTGQYCLDVAYGGSSDGTPVGLYPCNSNDSAQKWQIVGQSIFNPQSGKCLDDPSGEEGVELQIWDCNIGGNANQNWDIVGYQ